MKTLEIRYKAYDEKETISFQHTSFKHELGEPVLTGLKSCNLKMTVIAQEENMTDEGFRLVIELYNAHKGKLAKLGKSKFQAKIRLALHIATQIGKLSPEDQVLAYN